MNRALSAAAGILFPACARQGATGLPEASTLDFERLVRPSTPNTALAAPAGFKPRPDLVTPAYASPPAVLYAAVRRVALGQPRTYLHAADDARFEAHFVARSRVLNFPDLIATRIAPDGAIVLWSRSVYGASDLGVNLRRLTLWLAALDAELAPRT